MLDTDGFRAVVERSALLHGQTSNEGKLEALGRRAWRLNMSPAPFPKLELASSPEPQRSSTSMRANQQETNCVPWTVPCKLCSLFLGCSACELDVTGKLSTAISDPICMAGKRCSGLASPVPAPECSN